MASGAASADLAAGAKRRRTGGDGDDDETPGSKSWSRHRERKVLNAVVAWQADVAQLKKEAARAYLTFPVDHPRRKGQAR